ncbi:ADP-ribosylation factor-like protein 13B isoform X1 [Vespa crabro]|uniref:ADP-ribosylation factor-like protein 13B isoform X1 n=2 Tax=Vespa crabro TaxID=7445 RepID=UPI001EFF65B1|nr:ADP-ribosylation factor-like protein 13B isoform X1 [Vespa crabro]
MGNCLRSMMKKLRKKHHSEKNITLLIVGLDNAGKTLILNHIRGDPDKHVLPTMGFRIVCLKYKSYAIKIYDLGGSIQIRSLWPKYYNDIHGLIYVVDASDISRLAENKVVFGELVAHESISGKPLLLLANKQDLNGAIDELDVVDNLNVEHVVNTTRCPTRVETCSCFSEKEHVKNNTLGITNGYKWLLDTILRNYIVLNNRVKQSQNIMNEELKNQRITKDCKYSPPRLSVHSNPFKPIAELLSKKEGNNTENHLVNGIINGRSFKKFFMSNKTAPLSSESTFNINEDLSLHDSSNVITPVAQKSTQTITVIDLPSFDFYRNDEKNNRCHRPNTAPACSTLHNTISIINIPGQVFQ